MKSRPKELQIRKTEESDAFVLEEWLTDPLILRWFPMLDQKEIRDAVQIWVSYCKVGSALTATWNGDPCGMSTLYIQPFKKLAHTCLFSVIVSEKYRNLGVGTALLQELMVLAKEKFHIEILHLEVYEGNPAKRLYERLGFQEFGRQKHFIKEKDAYLAKIFMQKYLA